MANTLALTRLGDIVQSSDIVFDPDPSNTLVEEDKLTGTSPLYAERGGHSANRIFILCNAVATTTKHDEGEAANTSNDSHRPVCTTTGEGRGDLL